MTNPGASPKIGLALGSGASRGWSRIGITTALLREAHTNLTSSAAPRWAP